MEDSSGISFVEGDNSAQEYEEASQASAQSESKRCGDSDFVSSDENILCSGNDESRQLNNPSVTDDSSLSEAECDVKSKLYLSDSTTDS